MIQLLQEKLEKQKNVEGELETIQQEQRDSYLVR